MDAALKARSPHQNEGADSWARTAELVEALRSPACYLHPASDIRVMETHISYVILAGDFAYKIRKPVALDFLDFSTLEARRHDCEEELRLNRRTAPELYLEVVPIARTPGGLVVGACGPAVEFAVKMRRFRQDALFDRLAHEGRLEARHVDALARVVARFHGGAKRATGESEHGSAEGILEAAMDNFQAIESMAHSSAAWQLPRALRDWTLSRHAALRETFARRKAEGFVRECHGDLHLGNVVLLRGEPVLFDCIEFNPRLRWIDVMNDVAFTVMDLMRRDLPHLAARFLNAYVDETGDYEGLAVLRFNLVYRALVRAKVARIRVGQAGADARLFAASRTEFTEAVELAERLAKDAGRGIVLMHGLSGSGKTTVSQRLLEALGAIRLRSDVERKRLHGLSALARVEERPDAGIYSALESRRTYDRLALLAGLVLRASYPVIVDATFIGREEREHFRKLAAAARVPFAIVACAAPDAVLRARIAARIGANADASDAGLAVLDHQAATVQPLDEDERARALILDTTSLLGFPEVAAALARRLGLETKEVPCSTTMFSTAMPTASARFTS